MEEIETQMCGEEEFYEKIEAPKFVDFTTLPDDDDRYRLDDDRFWFCLRVGCDQKHEEEIDHEAISKDFVLRVMAARSPNVRLRKALTRNTNSIKDRCPLSAPTKHTLSRQSKLAVISSISQNKAEKGSKTKPISKHTSTPKLPKVKHVAAKYLTTPSHKICPTNTNNSFRSVQNTKLINIAVPKTKIVAKALFKSPKKGICVKTSAELRTPLTKICRGIKKLSINSQRKRVLGYSSKSSTEIKQKSMNKDKSKGSSLLRPFDRKEHNSKSLQGIKKKSKGEIGNVSETKMPNSVVKNELNDMDIDTKSRISYENDRNTALAVAKERSIVKFVEENKETDAKPRIINENNTNTVLADAEERLIIKFEEANKDIDTKSSMIDDNKTNTASADTKESSIINLEEYEIGKGNLKEKTEACIEKVRDEVEEIENDDKENDSAPDYNRSCARNALGKLEAETNKKVVKAQDKNLKEGLKAAATGTQVVKYKKPKPTNPKPFRLRTDERRILREAIMEIKAPLKESEAVATLDLDKKNRSEIEERRILREAIMEIKAPLKESEAVATLDLDKKNRSEIEKQKRQAERSIGERRLRKKAPNPSTQQGHSNLTKQCKNQRKILGDISEETTRKTKSPSMQPHFMMLIGGVSTKKTKPTETGKRFDNRRSLSRGKKFTTVSKSQTFGGSSYKKA